MRLPTSKEQRHLDQIKPGSIQTNDLSKGAKKALSGKTGPNGAQGPSGPAGAPATKLWAVVESDGTPRHGSGVVSVSGEPKNGTTVTFNRNVDNCAVIASVGRTGLGVQQGECSQTPDLNSRVTKSWTQTK